MYIALMSDVHDQLNNLQSALQKASKLGCCHLLFMGDFVLPQTLQFLLDKWPLPLDYVLGNNEYEQAPFDTLSQTRENVRFHGYYGTIRLHHRHLFFTHIPHEALSRGLHAGFDAIFYGHTHAAIAYKTDDNTLIVNPGEIAGRRGTPGFAVYDTTHHDVTFHTL